MEITETSIKAFHEEEDSGRLSSHRKDYLKVFKILNIPLTHKQATMAVDKMNVGIKKKMPERNGRVNELFNRGFLEVVDTVECEYTKKTVQRWKFTGRTVSKVEVERECVCDECGGRGRLVKKVWVEPDEILDSDIRVKRREDRKPKQNLNSTSKPKQKELFQ